MATKKDLAREVAPRYRAKKTKAGKTKILDEFVQSTGYKRKYAITVLNSEGLEKLRRIDGNLVKLKIAHKSGSKRKRDRYYDADVASMLIKIWEHFDQMGGERLVVLIRDNIDALRADDKGRFNMTDTVRKKLLEISRSTVERILKPVRQMQKVKGSCSTKPGSVLRNQIPVKVYWPWDDQKPGFCEIDTVSHDGGNASGHFCHTLTVTEIAHQWTLNYALLNNAHRWVKESLDDCRKTFPVQLKGIDSDNGSEFINYGIKAWCDEHHIDFTRIRPYHKNDNCYVEQKNDDRVRRFVGYDRIEDKDMRDALSLVYHYLNPLANFFFPCKKLIDKKRTDNKTKKIYDKPKTPYQRLLDDPLVIDSDKDILRQAKADLNIVELKDGLDEALDRLHRMAYDAAKKREAHG